MGDPNVQTFLDGLSYGLTRAIVSVVLLSLAGGAAMATIGAAIIWLLRRYDRRPWRRPGARRARPRRRPLGPPAPPSAAQ